MFVGGEFYIPFPATHTGFPKKDARFSKLKNISDLLSDYKEGKMKENMG